MFPQQIKIIRVAAFSLGWLALTALPSPWWRVVPCVLFILPAFLTGELQQKVTFGRLPGWLTAAAALALLTALLALGGALDDWFGRESTEVFVRSWPFALSGWIVTMLALAWGARHSRPAQVQ